MKYSAILIILFAVGSTDAASNGERESGAKRGAPAGVNDAEQKALQGPPKRLRRGGPLKAEAKVLTKSQMDGHDVVDLDKGSLPDPQSTRETSLGPNVYVPQSSISSTVSDGSVGSMGFSGLGVRSLGSLGSLGPNSSSPPLPSAFPPPPPPPPGMGLPPRRRGMGLLARLKASSQAVNHLQPQPVVAGAVNWAVKSSSYGSYDNVLEQIPATKDAQVIIYLLDCSGSMDTRIAKAVNTIKDGIRHAKESSPKNTKIMILTFNENTGKAGIDIKMNKNVSDITDDEINDFNASVGGGTPLWEATCETLEAITTPEFVKVISITDGANNLEYTKTEDDFKAAIQTFKNANGLFTSVTIYEEAAQSFFGTGANIIPSHDGNFGHHVRIASLQSINSINHSLDFIDSATNHVPSMSIASAASHGPNPFSDPFSLPASDPFSLPAAASTTSSTSSNDRP